MAYEIRSLSFAEILDTAFALLRDHFVVLVAIAAFVYVPFSIAQAALINLEPGTPPGTLYWIGIALAFIIMIVGGPLAQLAVTFTVAETYLGGKLTIAQAYSKSASLYLPYVGTMLLLVLGMLAGFLLFIIPGIYVAVLWMLVGPVAVIEGIYGPRAMGRSRTLMRGNWWRGASIVFLAALLGSVILAGFDFIFAFIPVIGPVLSGVIQSVVFAFNSAVLVLLYFDLRCRHEDFDLRHLVAQIGIRTEQGSSTASR